MRNGSRRDLLDHLLRLIRHWLGQREGFYSQAIEAQRDLQIDQVFQDLRPALDTRLVPRSWPELFELLAAQKRPWTLCLDEFPYFSSCSRRVCWSGNCRMAKVLGDLERRWARCSLKPRQRRVRFDVLDAGLLE